MLGSSLVLIRKEDRLSTTAFTFEPLTPDRWHDFETLFGPHGATGGCWCMFWLVSRQEFERQAGKQNKDAMQALVFSGRQPGILAYSGETPAGWCALAPRPVYKRLEHSRILRPVDDQPVWSIVCFFVARSFRGQGLTVALLKAAVQYAATQGARLLEGYPVEPEKGKAPDPFVYTGVASAFRQAGFVEVARRSDTRPIMRYYIEEKSP
jgi:GNAT superfamily N-acetyltransferase